MERNNEDIRLLSQQVYDMSAEFSAFMNKQEGVNDKILGYLENNPNTDQKGYIAKVDKNSMDIKEIKDKWYKATTVAVVASATATWIGKYIWDKI
jgi:hypothetical protein